MLVILAAFEVRESLAFAFVRYVNLIQVVIVAGFHLFPFRTEKLSPPAPMVLHTRGRVGSRRFLAKPSREISEAFFVASSQHSTEGKGEKSG